MTRTQRLHPDASLLVHEKVQPTSISSDLSLEFLEEHGLEGLAILSKLLDTFMELVEGHLVLEKLPAEFRFIVDIGNLLDWLGLCGGLCVEPLGDGIGALPQLLEERR